MDKKPANRHRRAGEAALPPSPPPSEDHRIGELATVRDWLRHAVSRFRAAGLAFGHGSATALDEAAYLILHALHLPIDDISPWLDARLLADERGAIAALIDRRIATRKPASYLTGEAWIGGTSFRVDERVIVPRSYIGELIVADGLSAVVSGGDEIKRVLDLCTGSGCLAILAALAWPAARVDAVDISEPALEVARLNIADYGLEDRVHPRTSDLFADLGRDRYDLILSNPPYVSAEAVAAFPPEWQAEPVLAHAGGADGMDLVRRILAEAPRHLKPGGSLVMEIGSGRPIIEAEHPDLDLVWLDSAASSGEMLWLRRRA